MEKRDKKSIQNKLIALGVAVVILFAILGVNLWRLQIANAAVYEELAAGNVMKNITTPAMRGKIVDSKGVVLARSVPQYTLSLDWTDLQRVNKDDWKDVVAKLAGYIKPYWPYKNQSVELITEDIFVMIRNQQWQSYRPVTILEKAPVELQAIIAEHSNELPGVSIEPVPVREYPQKTLLGQVLGYVREISEAEIEQFNKQAAESNDPYRYSQGDLVGKMGVEKSYDSWLRGNHGKDRIGVDRNGRPIARETLSEPQPGYTIQLTTDTSLQKVVEDELTRVINEVARKHPYAKGGAAVVLEVKTGKVLAMASKPYMDPNELIGIISDETANRYFTGEDKASFNRAISGAYPPGSTFKMITAMAALEANLVTPEETFYDSLSTLGGIGIGEWGGNNFGHVNLYRGMAKSSNIYFQAIGRRVFDKQPELIRKICHEFSLGVPTGIDIPGEATGMAPSPQWKKDYFGPIYEKQLQEQLEAIEEKYATLLAEATDNSQKDKLLMRKKQEIATAQASYQDKVNYYVDWILFDSFNNSIGQGYNSYTLIQLANYVATIVNGGYNYKPYVVDKILDPITGEVVLQKEPQLNHKVTVSPETLAIIKKSMSQVTSGDGTAAWLFTDMPQYSGGGKTGTAQLGSRNTEKGNQYNGMYVAFAPYDDPEIAFAGLVEYGGHGSETAGYVAKAVFKKYFGW
ncbi:MAG: penicillin-binding protein 2 [Peptococcaceae bacterium]|jgi:penicillin-binding protein 2|nr:penicillin-binding protein 2 [Peptococcaceae bacterium]